MSSLLPALATNNSITIISWEHPECWSCRCFHVKFGPHVAQGESVRHRDFHTRATATHLFKHFAALSQKESHSMLPALCKCNLSNLPAPKPKALVQVLLTINQFPTLQSFGLIIPTLHVGSRTNRWNAHSQINTNLLSICCVSFWHVPAQGGKGNTS